MMLFEKLPDGRILGGFTPLESELLNDLATQVVELLDDGAGLPPDRLLASVGIGGSDGPSSDPAIARLLPTAYPDDESAAQEFRYLTEHSLVSRKVANARLFKRTLDGGGEVQLEPEAQQAWLRTLTDIRLIIASRLGIEHDGDEGSADSDEAIMMRDVYDWLAEVQDSLVDALD
jgi:hypothetical protein